MEPASNPTIKNMRGSTVLHLINGSGFSKLPNSQQSLLELFEFDYRNPPLHYPYDKYLQLAEHIKETLYSRKSPDEAFEELGYLAIQDYFQGIVGQVVRATVSLIRPERGAKQFLIKMRSILPWATHEIEEINPKYVRYSVKNLNGPPALMRGVLRASLEVTGAKNIKVNSTVISSDHVIHEAYWG